MVHYFRSTRTTLILLLLSLIAQQNTIAPSQRGVAAFKLNNVMLDGERGGVKINKWKRSARKMAMDQVNTAVLNTGANPSSTKCEHGGDDESSLGSQRSNRRSKVVVYFAGLTPFSSDYGAPKNHPPKNN